MHRVGSAVDNCLQDNDGADMKRVCSYKLLLYRGCGYAVLSDVNVSSTHGKFGKREDHMQGYKLKGCMICFQVVTGDRRK